MLFVVYFSLWLSYSVHVRRTANAAVLYRLFTDPQIGCLHCKRCCGASPKLRLIRAGGNVPADTAESTSKFCVRCYLLAKFDGETGPGGYSHLRINRCICFMILYRNIYRVGSK